MGKDKKCLFHKWNGCTCTKCGKKRDRGHDWNGCTCTKCGKKRDSGHDWKDNRCTICKKWNPDTTKCEVCGKTKGQFEREEQEFAARMKALGAGIIIGGGVGGLMKCPNCGKIACNKCAIVLPGHDTKTCPFCGKDYSWGSVL